ncbi:reverse transcriptase domain-containing protein [Tanacetum coccineum]|uniref:Reverse transcriptase domain-containing protein n=1 Tax=Tanacetum coccineum TaxID=301880 RepID=A0ABQ5FHW0_9ASTR
MDDEPMWAADRVVAPTPGSTITIPKTANEYAIKGNHLTLVKGNQFEGRIKTDLHKHIHEFLGICDMFKYRDTENEAVHQMMFPLSLTGEAKTWRMGSMKELSQHEGSSNSDTDKIMAQIDAMTMKMDAQYKELQSRSKQPNPDHNDDDTPMDEGLNVSSPVNADGKDNEKKDDTTVVNEEAKSQNQGSLWEKFKASKEASSSKSKFTSLDDDDEEVYMPDGIHGGGFMDGLEDDLDCYDGYGTQVYDLTPQEQAFVISSSSKPYQPPQAQNEQVNAVFTRSGKSYDPPINPNDQPTNSETPVNFDSEDEDEEPTLQPKPKDPKPVKETPTPKPYKPKISYPQCLRKEKMEAQYGKFLDMIQAVRINVHLVDVLAGMPNYRKYLKELVSNKHKLEQISVAFLSDESSALIQNKVPPKVGDPKSFLIPCNFNKAFSCDALADLADRSFQYLVGIAENMLGEVGKSTFLVDFVILEIEEDKVPLILGRPFLYTADVVIRVKQKQLNLGVGTERMTFHMHSAMKHSYSNDDTCFSIDVIDEILKEDFDALLDEVDSPWVSPIHCVPKKGGITVVTNEKNELVPTRTVTGWRIENDETSDDSDVDDNFPGETLMEITTNDTAWRVPFKQRNEPPAQPKVVYALILDINYFRHFLDISENYNPMDDEPMWAADRVVAPTPSSAITIPETANEFVIKGEAKTWLDELSEGTITTWDEL